MCHHLTDAERERLRELATDREVEETPDPVDDTETEPELTPAPSD